MTVSIEYSLVYSLALVFSSEMSRGLDPETAFLTSWYNKRILPKLSNRRHQSENAIPEQKHIFRFWLKITTADNIHIYIYIYIFIFTGVLTV